MYFPILQILYLIKYDIPTIETITPDCGSSLRKKLIKRHPIIEWIFDCYEQYFLRINPFSDKSGDSMIQHHGFSDTAWPHQDSSTLDTSLSHKFIKDRKVFSSRHLGIVIRDISMLPPKVLETNTILYFFWRNRYKHRNILCICLYYKYIVNKQIIMILFYIKVVNKVFFSTINGYLIHK